MGSENHHHHKRFHIIHYINKNNLFSCCAHQYRIPKQNIHNLDTGGKRRRLGYFCSLGLQIFPEYKGWSVLQGWEQHPPSPPHVRRRQEYSRKAAAAARPQHNVLQHYLLQTSHQLILELLQPRDVLETDSSSLTLPRAIPSRGEWRRFERAASRRAATNSCPGCWEILWWAGKKKPRLWWLIVGGQETTKLMHLSENMWKICTLGGQHGVLFVLLLVLQELH